MADDFKITAERMYKSAKTLYESTDGGGLIQGVIIPINYNFNSGRVHTQRLTKGAGFPHEYATALAQRTVDGFHNTCSATPLGAAAMVPAG